MSEIQRDLYIDTMRGLCVVSIVFIHTVFWSGYSYTPLWIRNLALLIDVPLFFFLTGCTMNIYPKMNPLKQIFKLAILFFFAVLICQIVYWDFNFKHLIEPLILSSAYVPQVKILRGSYWFVPVYAIGILWAKIILDYLKPIIVKIFMFLVPVFYCYLYFFNEKYDTPAVLAGGKNVSIQMVLFYIWLIILGYKLYNFNKKIVWFIVSFSALLITIVFAVTQNEFNLQTNKFPVALPYIIATMISIGVVMGCKRNVKNNFLAYLGQRAMCFYISQGISSSILISIARVIHTNWVLKLFICFSLNLLMAIVINQEV